MSLKGSAMLGEGEGERTAGAKSGTGRDGGIRQLAALNRTNEAGVLLVTSGVDRCDDRVTVLGM